MARDWRPCQLANVAGTIGVHHPARAFSIKAILIWLDDFSGKGWSNDIQEDFMGNGAVARRDPFVAVLIYLVVAEDAKLVADELGSGPTFNSEGLLQGSIEKGLELGHGNHVHVGVVQDVWNMFSCQAPHAADPSWSKDERKA